VVLAKAGDAKATRVAAASIVLVFIAQLRFGFLDCVVQPGPELSPKVPYRNAQFFDAMHKQLIEPAVLRAWK
jgi:hypothetical protein